MKMFPPNERRVPASLCVVVFLFLILSPFLTRAADVKDYLLPLPKTLKVSEGNFSFPGGRIISQSVTNEELLRSVVAIQRNLFKLSGKHYSIAGIAATGESPAVSVIVSEKFGHPQGYQLIIESDKIAITANDAPGLWYAALTLSQLGKYMDDHGHLPAVSITDWPDIPQRGVMLDISRDKVPSMESLYRYIDMLAAWKINEIQLYTEHTFAYRNHPIVWENASPITAEEIVLLDAYCKERFISLVPNQNSFAHMGRWLDHEPYKLLLEAERSGVISPAAPGSLLLLEEMYNELLPNFTSPYFNIGCDETERLGTGLSKELTEKKGKGRVYMEFVLSLKKLAEKNGKKVQFWGDIILHHPELIPELPKDITSMVWGYEADHPFEKQCAVFKQSNIDFYVCPGTSSWNAIIGRSENAFQNLKNAAVNGKKFGAMGFLNTDWGDNGHWQPVSVSYPAYLYGAALSWSVEENMNIDVKKYLNSHLFNDRTGIMGDVLVSIGDAYLESGIITFNSNIFNAILTDTRSPVSEGHWIKNITKEKLEKAIVYMNTQLDRMKKATPSSYEADLVKEEIELATQLCLHACKQGIYKLEAKKGDIRNVPAARKAELKREFESILTRYQALWLVRNRPGGLHDSVEKLRRYAGQYY